MPLEGFVMPEETTTTETTETTGPQGLDAYLESLDDEGRKAVKGEIDKARGEAKRYRTQLREQQTAAQAAQAAAQAATQTAEQRAAAQEAATAQRLQVLVEKSARAEIKALAADKFADPEDAAVYLKASDFIDDNGDVRSYELGAAIDDLLERKPHLAKKQQTRETRQPAPDGSQGGSGGRRGPADPKDIFGSWLQTRLPGGQASRTPL